VLSSELADLSRVLGQDVYHWELSFAGIRKSKKSFLALRNNFARNSDALSQIKNSLAAWNCRTARHRISGQCEWPENRLFRFLVSRSPEISLGTKIAALDGCRRSVIPTHIELRKYIENNSAAIFEHVREPTRIKQLRDPAVHPEKIFRRSDNLKIVRDGQVLNALMPLPKAER
jgi:hypothetical protein